MPPPSPEIDALYREAVTLADQARGWFDGPGLDWRRGLALDHQAVVATESLAVTARLMAVIAWALDSGHADPAAPRPRFGAAAFMPFAESSARSLGETPGARIAIAAHALVERVAALDTQSSPPEYR